MKDTAPKELGIIAVSALFGLIALLVSYFVLDYTGFASLLIGAIVALISAILLWFGWREPAAGPTGPRDLSANANAEKAAGYATKAPAATPLAAAPTAAAPTAAASTAAPAATATATPAAFAAPAAEATAPEAAAPEAVAAKPAAKPAAKKAAKPAAKKPAAKSAKPAAKTAKAAKPAAKAASTKAAKPAAAKAKRAPVAADGKPETLTGPRPGTTADDLKQIKGVGPGLEKTLNELGFYHFDQIQDWRKAEIEWVDSRLKFKGRIVRDEWTKQAKTLAKGGTTEFSKKVKKGGVY